MKATEAKLLDFLKKSPQFVIPVYQRTYSWSEKECRQLWDDIMPTGRETWRPQLTSLDPSYMSRRGSIRYRASRHCW
jgi:hypothetical protein